MTQHQQPTHKPSEATLKSELRCVLCDHTVSDHHYARLVDCNCDCCVRAHPCGSVAVKTAYSISYNDMETFWFEFDQRMAAEWDCAEYLTYGDLMPPPKKLKG